MKRGKNLRFLNVYTFSLTAAMVALMAFNPDLRKECVNIILELIKAIFMTN